MSKNAELMSTAPSCFVQDTCPPSVSGKSSGQTEHHSLRQVTTPSFLHVTPKYYYLRWGSSGCCTVVLKGMAGARWFWKTVARAKDGFERRCQGRERWRRTGE